MEAPGLPLFVISHKLKCDIRHDCSLSLNTKLGRPSTGYGRDGWVGLFIQFMDLHIGPPNGGGWGGGLLGGRVFTKLRTTYLRGRA